VPFERLLKRSLQYRPGRLGRPEAVHDAFRSPELTILNVVWDPERLVEQAFDIEKALALFEESNRLYPSP
jgi:hypothetical protein